MARPDPPDAGATLADWLRWQESLHPQAIALGLERVARVADRLGLRQDLTATLTVAGTNGKGSCATLLARIYEAAGYRVGLYTSPHLYRYNERVVIDGAPVGDAALCRAFNAVEAARRGEALTYFEFGTLAALWLFREAGVAVRVLEVGLGGRLDAVNIIDPDLALLTNVGLDHQEWLGPDREAIGREKAGIFRQDRPAVYADRDPPASVQQAATALSVPLWVLGRDFEFMVAADAWSWRGGGRCLKKLPPPGLAGAAQLDNAAGVLAAVERLQGRLPVSEEAIRSGLARLSLPGRFERRGRWILDVAHNAEAAAVLAGNLKEHVGQPVVLVLGMLSDKPVERFCAALRPLVRRAFFASLPGPRGLRGADLERRARAAGLAGEAVADVKQALARAAAMAGPEEPVLVCGSFLTVSAAGAELHG